jgi:alpha-2-macroglobulin-like protein
MSLSPEPSSSQAVLKPSFTIVRKSSRAAKWLVGLASFALVTISIAGYFYHQFQMTAIAAEHLRLMVIGPSILQSGVAAQFDITTTEVTGMPVSIPVEVDLYSPDGKQFWGRKESTDQQGRLAIIIPADMSLPAMPTIKVAALYRGSCEQMSANLAVDRAQLATRLSLDKPIYQPGETVFYHSLSLSRFGLAVDREIPIHFEILGPVGAVVPNSMLDGTTDHGVGNGIFNIPDDLPGGQYTLLARSLDGSFPDENRKFVIRRYRQPRLKKELVFLRDSYAPGNTVEADFSAKRSEGEPAATAKLRILATVDGQSVLEKNAQTDKAGVLRIEFKLPEKIARGDGQLAVTIDDGGTRETIAKAIPINLGKVDVQFYPEGGDLVAGLENRVYFVCRNLQSKPERISGVIVSTSGREMASVETIREGMGLISFTPHLGESYRLKIVTPADIKDEPKLPAPVTDCPIVLTTGTGVFGQSEPLEFNIRSSKADIPLVVGAWCRGVLVGQVALVTRKSENGMNPVVLNLPDEACGVIRLTVFDYSINTDKSKPQFPKPLAERLVYRRSARRLNVRANDVHEHYAPGETVNMSLAVTNEKNEPVAGAVSVSVVDESLFALADDHTPSMPTYFLLTSEIEKPENLESADFYLSDKTSSPVALDLLLGTQGWRRFAEKSRQQLTDDGPEKNRLPHLAAMNSLVGPPTMFDNLGRIRTDYQKSLAAYYADRSQYIYSVITISFLGALGLLLLVLMMGLLRIVRGGSFWLPVLGTIACSAIIGALLTDPLRFTSSTNMAVPFMPYQAPAETPTSKNNIEEQKKSTEGKTADKSTPAQSNRRTESPTALPSQAPQLEQVIARPNSPHVEKPITGPVAPSKAEPFAVRQYAHQHVAGQAGAQGDLAETLFWNPLMIATQDGKVSLSFALPDSPATFRLHADAHGAGRIGSCRLEIPSKTTGKSDGK